MFIASVLSFLDDLYQYVDGNKTCYSYFSLNEVLDISIFLVIRLISYYVIMGLCLYVFRVEKEEAEKEILHSPSEELISWLSPQRSPCSPRSVGSFSSIDS